MKVIVELPDIRYIVPVKLTEDKLFELNTEYGKVFLPDRKYFYHISTKSAAESINKTGLKIEFKGTRKKPNQGIPTDVKAIYVTNNPYKLIHPDNGSGSFFDQRQELVLYRIKRSFVNNFSPAVDHQYPLGNAEAPYAFYIYHDIPPEELEYHGVLTTVIGEEGYHVNYTTLDIFDNLTDTELKKLRSCYPQLFRDGYRIAIYTEFDPPRKVK